MKIVADLHLQLLRRGSKRKSPLHVTVGIPQPDDDFDWYCPVRLKGINPDERRIFGVDSRQALILALRFAELTLRHEVRKGGQLFYLGQKISVGRLFASGVRV